MSGVAELRSGPGRLVPCCERESGSQVMPLALYPKPSLRVALVSWLALALALAFWPAVGTRVASAQRPARPPATRVAPPDQRQALVLPPLPIPADSVAGDNAAFNTLPAQVRQVLDVRQHIRAFGGDPAVVCVPLSTTADGSRRQRLQGRLRDGLSLVVFARATRDGVLSRVEFVRRLPTGGQAGYTWDTQGDATMAMEWAPRSSDATSHPVPRGGPIPRALRGLGRIVLTWRCAES